MATAPYAVGGTVSGLSGTLVLQESRTGESIALTSNGAFTFIERAPQDASYTVSVYQQPAGQNCAVASGSGTATTTVNNITVSCGNHPFAVSGTVSGLASPITLQLNLADNVTVNTSGAFSFPGTLAAGTTYAVTVAPGAANSPQSCTVANGAGTISASVTNVAVSCAPATTVTVGGAIQGLSGPLTLALNTTGAPATHTATADGAFEFSSTVAPGTNYLVSVSAQPPGQYCVVSNAAGVASVSRRIPVAVWCTTGAMPASFTVGGTITGLTGTLQLLLSTNNAPLSIDPAGATTPFTFGTALPTGTDFRVMIGAQPPGQTCIVPNGGTVMGVDNITSIAVVCVANTTDPLSGTFIRYNSDAALTLYPDGIYVYAAFERSAACGPSQGNGVEVGAYRYNAPAGTITFISNVIDTNGTSCGLWRDGASAFDGSLAKTGAGQYQVLAISSSSSTPANVWVPVPSVPGTPIGSFTNGTRSFTAFLPDGRYIEANVVNDPASEYPAGVETGCFTRTGTSSGTITVVSCPGSVDTDGWAGLSVLSGGPMPYEAVGDYAVNFGSSRYFGTRILPGN